MLPRISLPGVAIFSEWMDYHQVVWIVADRTDADRRTVVDWVAHDNALFQLERLIE